MFEKGLLAGKRILVTGGGSGLGAAMGRRFIELGAELIICGRRLEMLEATAARMRSELGGKVGVISCDIRDSAAVDAMMEAIWREAPIDVLVNNAAATFIAQTEHLSPRAADAILAGLRRADGRLGRSWKDGRSTGEGVLEDYADLADGLLALYEATFEERWFAAAREIGRAHV